MRTQARARSCIRQHTPRFWVEHSTSASSSAVFSESANRFGFPRMIAAPDAPALRGSFRDPAGSLLHHRGRVLRIVRRDFAENLEAFLRTNVARNAVTVGEMVRTERVSSQDFPEFEIDSDDLLFEHERIEFPSYPYEWAPE